MQIIEEEEELAPTKKILFFGLEAIIAMTLGTFFLLCSAISLCKTKLIEKLIEKSAHYLPILKLFGLGEQLEENRASRIGADNCCICLGNINWEVSSTCGHIFCGISFLIPILT